MCGICGFISLGSGQYMDRDTISAMNQVMHHRGPDDEGIYLGLPNNMGGFEVALGHRRLSIIDLSAHGHQPMSNEDGSIWIVYNGEVYNFIELKDYLVKRGHRFKSHTDTEVIIHLYEEKGKDCVQYLRGMFSFAIWDINRKSLFAARDRLGVKPFYYYSDGSKFIFASEVKSILASQKLRPQVDRSVIDSYLSLGYVPAPKTMFAGVEKLKPGYTLSYERGNVYTEKFWDFDKIEPGDDKGEKHYIEQLQSLLEECVRIRLVSDVPLGVFLSGGVDSSSVVGLMSRMCEGNPIKTFCVGYRDKQASELEYARIIAKRFATDHHEYYLEPTDFYEFIPKLIWYFDEPVVDAAAIPLYFISKLAREHVTVLLSGEGADELFAGYSIYNTMRAIERYRMAPAVIRSLFLDKLVLSGIRSSKIRQKLGEWLKLPLQERYRGVPAENSDSLKDQLYSASFKDELKSGNCSGKYLESYFESVAGKDALSKMLYVDTKVWLPDDLLVKADKMSMATSVELRVPFLDYKLVEFAASVPSKYKIKNSVTKYLLKRSVEKLLPREIIYRKKKGFPVPINAWFKGDFSEKASDILLDSKSLEKGYFDKNCISRIIREHKSGREDYSKLLFSLMVLEIWHRTFIK